MVPPLQGQAVEQEKATLACFTPKMKALGFLKRQ